MAQSISARHARTQPIDSPPSLFWNRLTQAAFVISLALVCCRLLMGESIRNSSDLSAGGARAPASPGAACGIVLDLLFCIPALLVLARRAFDDHFRLLFFWSYLPMALLALLTALSPLWAADRFAAAVSASHVCCALIFIWSSSQLLRSWIHLRLTAGACVGLLLALASVGYTYRLVEMADLRQMWQEHRSEIIAAHGWKDGSYEAHMFENRVLRGQPMGFSTSTNTYAALLVLLGIVSAGVAIQHAADGDHWGWILIPAVAAASIVPPILWTACRAALATPIIAALILIAVWLSRRRLARFATAGYALGVGAVALAAAIVVRHGMRYGTLWHDSLNFRWRYWVGAYRALTAGLNHSPRQYFQLFFGVGWENFGPYYLIHRLPIASEEIRDPHNFIVRIFVELGLIGGTLALLWLLRLGWELTRPTLLSMPAMEKALQPSSGREISAQRERRNAAMAMIAMIAFTAIAINVAASVDFTSDGWFVFLEIIRRALFWCALAIGLGVAALRVPAAKVASRQPQQVHFELDPRPAPWILYAILAALGTFLIHNLIEFSLFEPGPLFLFALLAGQALGTRSETKTQQPGTGSQGNHRRVAATIGTAAVAGAWLAAAIFLAMPILSSEALAHDADDNALTAAALRTGKNASPRQAQELMARAAEQMTQASRQLPWNADYASRAARLLIAAGGADHDAAKIEKLLDAAVHADPSSAEDWVLRAQFESAATPNADAARADYERALTLDPNNVRLRLEFARALKRQAKSNPARGGQALLEFDRALDMNNQLAPLEVKRLSPQEMADAQHAVAELENDATPRR